MKRAIVILAIAAAACGVIAIRVVVAGRTALASGVAAEARGHVGDAIRAYETAARWYLPMAPHVDDAYDRLRALAASEDPAVALAAWRGIRGAARATRSLWTPHAGDLEVADREIAARLGRAAAAGGPAVDATWHRERLAYDPRPTVAMAILAALGILMWLVGAAILVRRGIGPDGGLRRPALVAGAVIVLGLGCWAVSLYNA